MSVRGWLRRRRRERRWRKAERKERGPLREFVYLDEVAVYSLIASQVGLVVTEITDTQATSLQTELSSGIGVSTPLKAEVGSKLQAGESQSSQVLRKAIIQTTFEQLRDAAERSKALKLRAEPDLAPVQSLDDIKRLATGDGSSLVVPPGRLVRGDLVELEYSSRPSRSSKRAWRSPGFSRSSRTTRPRSGCQTRASLRSFG